MNSFSGLFEIVLIFAVFIGVPVLGILVLALFCAKLTRGRRATEEVPSIPVPEFQHHHDRWFSSEQKNEGHGRAGNRCEYTDKRNQERCKGKSQEGDHFYPYAKGGASTLENFVSACRYHNQLKSGNVWAHEKIAIEQRRMSYFPAGASVAVGDWQPVIRLSWEMNRYPVSVMEDNTRELVESFKQAVTREAGRRRVYVDHNQLNRLDTPADLVDFLWNSKGFYLTAVEGYDSAEGRFFKLAKWSK